MEINNIKAIRESDFEIIEAVAGKLSIENVRFVGENRRFKLFLTINNAPFFFAKHDGTPKLFLTEASTLRFAKSFLKAKNVMFDLEDWSKECENQDEKELITDEH